MPELRTALEKQIRFLAGKGITTFLAGGARGFDAFAAAAVLRIKESLPALRLVLVLPCPDQDKGWPELDKALHDEITRRADGVITLFDEYAEGCMLQRNRFMVDNSIVCLAYYNRKKIGGGTYHTVTYAERQGVMLVNFYKVHTEDQV
jgi:uncharacterized phage-like protein YoqJ